MLGQKGNTFRFMYRSVAAIL